MSDPAQVESVIRHVLETNADEVAAYRAGKAQLFGFFVGQVMKATKGKANPQLVNQLLRRALGSESKEVV
jgi:aspartyl-tRNA(Asn)/glutamyl-tRNA(Gln) amidotransferase subunit B